VKGGYKERSALADCRDEPVIPEPEVQVSPSSLRAPSKAVISCVLIIDSKSVKQSHPRKIACRLPVHVC
jgi:hypothetical protein